MRRSKVAVLIAIGALALAGCGSSGRAGPAPPGTPAGSSATAVPGVVVDIRDYGYHPADITVPVGTTVTWVQDDSTIHTVTDPGRFDSKHLSRGQRYRFTFRTPGTYDYVCTVHPPMHGSVTVR